jgi:hypothetical protein
MATPIDNANFALSLFDRAVEPALRVNETKRNLALQVWKDQRDMEREDRANRQRMTELDKQLQNQRAIADEQTTRAIKVADATEARQLSKDLRALYGRYSALIDDGRPLADFGKTEAEQFAALQQEVGKLEQANLIADSESRLYQQYLAVAGNDAKKLAELGKTPRERTEAMIREIGPLSEKQDRELGENIRSQIDSIDGEIAAKMTLSSDEVAAAKSRALEQLSSKELDIYNKAIKSGLGEEAALGVLAQKNPAAYQKLMDAMSTERSNIIMFRTTEDRGLASLQARRRALETAILTGIKNPRVQLYALGVKAAEPAQETKPRAAANPQAALEEMALRDWSSATDQSSREQALSRIAPNRIPSPILRPGEPGYGSYEPTVITPADTPRPVGPSQAPAPVASPAQLYDFSGVKPVPQLGNSDNRDAVFQALRSFISPVTTAPIRNPNYVPGDPKSAIYLAGSAAITPEAYLKRIQSLDNPAVNSAAKVNLLRRAVEQSAKLKRPLPPELVDMLNAAGASPIK